MPTVVDALIVTLSLDPKNFTKEQKAAVSDYLKSRKEIESESGKIEQAFSKVKNEALAMFAVLVGANDIKSFVADTTAAENALGRMADQADQSVGSLSAWGNIVKQIGGDGKAAQSAMAGFAHELANASITGHSQLISLLSPMGITPFDKNKKLKDMMDIYEEMAAYAHGKDKLIMSTYFQKMGLDEGTIQMILKGRDAIRAARAEQVQLGNVTDKDRQAADALTVAFSKASQAIGTLARNILTFATPTMVNALNWIPGAVASLINYGTDKTDFVGKQIHNWPTTRMPLRPRSPAPLVHAGSADADAMRYATAAQAQYGIPWKVTYAQWALESAHGTRMPAGSNNPFGIKAGKNQAGVWAWTTEEIHGVRQKVYARFAKYASLADAFAAHAHLLATDPRYAGARAHSDDPNAFADQLTGVYASDHGYGASLKAVMAHLPTAGGARHIDRSVHIANINIHGAKDAKGFARDLRTAVDRAQIAGQANYGPN